MAFTPGSGKAVISLGVDGASSSRKDIDSVADSLKKVNDSSFQKLSGQVSAIQSHLGGLKSTFTDLAQLTVAGFSAGAFVGMIKGSLDAADNLNDLSKTTGVAVATLSGLKLAAQQSGGDLEGIADSINKLSVAMGKDAEKFSRIGVTAKEPLEAFKQLADVFSAIDDPQTRAALGAATLGKNWASAAPLLAEGGTRIGEMVTKGTALAGTTQEMADRADEFNDKMAEMGAAIDGAKMKLANEMVPAMTEITTAIMAAYEESGKLQAIWVGMGALGSFLFTDEFSSAKVKIENLRGELAQLEQDLSLSKNSPAFGFVGRALWGESTESLEADVARVKGQIEALKRTMEPPTAALTDAFGDRFMSAVAGYQARSIIDGDAEEKKREAAAKAATAAALRQQEAYAGLTNSIKGRVAATERELAGLAPLNEAEKLQIDLTERLKSGKLKLSPVHKAEYEQYIQTLGANLALIESQQVSNRVREATAKLLKGYQDVAAKTIADATEEAERNEELAHTFGLTAGAVAQLEVARLEEQLAQRSSLALTADEIEILERLIGVKKRNAAALGKREGLESSKRANDELVADAKRSHADIERSLTDALMRGFESGKGFAANLVDTIENMFSTLVLRPVVQGGVQSGMGMAGAMVGTPGTASAASSLMGNVGTASSLYGAYTSSSLGQFASGFSGSAGAASQALGAPMTGAAQAGSNVAGGLGAGGATPWLGMAAGGFAAYNVGQKHGAVAGAAAGFGTVAAGGALTGAVAGTGAMAGATGALAAMGPWGWAAMAAIAIVGAMQKGPEEATRLVFGSNNKAGNISINERGNEGKVTQEYIDGSSKGAFGSFGVVSSFWMNAAQPAVQGFIQSVTATDDALAQFMTETEKAATIASLTGRTTLSNSGREGSDPNGLGGLDRVFRDRIETVFNTVDPALTRLLDGFKGTSQDLANEAVALLDYRKNLPAASAAIFGATVTLQDLAALRTPTEAVSAALGRVTNAFVATNGALDTMGEQARQAFEALGLGSLAARQRLIDLSGGIEALTQNVAGYAQNFLTEQERMKPVAEALAKAMGDLGYASVDTREEFAALVQGLNPLSEAEAKTYVELMKLQGAFAMVHPALQAVAGAVQAVTETVIDQAALMRTAASSLLGGVDDAFSVLQRVAQGQIDTLTLRIAKERALSDAIRSTLDSMAMPGNEIADRGRAQEQMRSALTAAKAGKMPDATILAKSLNVLSQDAAGMFSTYEEYARDFYKTQSDIAALGAVADTALSVDEKALNAIEEMLRAAQEEIDVLHGIDTNGLTMIQAIEGVRLAILAAQDNALVSSTASIKGAYQSVLGRAPDTAGMEFFQDKVASGTPTSAIVDAIKNSPEAKVQELYRSLLGRTGDAAGVSYWTKAINAGMSEQAVRDMMMQSAEYKKPKSIPGFASGGEHTGGARIVGERGPELEITGPSRIVSNRDLMSSLRNPAENNAVLAAAVERLTRQLDNMRTETRAVAVHTEKTARLLSRVIRTDALITRPEEE